MTKSLIIIFNKPFNVICQFSPHEKYKTLKDYINLPNFYPAGRLDTDSEGLLILTNDGKIQNKISSPHFKLEKTYLTQVDGQMTDEAIIKLKSGVKLKEFTTKPAKVNKIADPSYIWSREPPIRKRKLIPTSWIRITITEGKNRQVRRMCAAVGFPCLRLIRIQIGNINLNKENLEQGKWKQIDINEL